MKTLQRSSIMLAAVAQIIVASCQSDAAKSRVPESSGEVAMDVNQQAARSGRPEPVPPGWCVAANHPVDSTYMIEAGRRALTLNRSDGPRSAETLYRSEQGFIVQYVSRGKVLGGGGLVWIDGETGCAIVLRRFE